MTDTTTTEAPAAPATTTTAPAAPTAPFNAAAALAGDTPPAAPAAPADPAAPAGTKPADGEAPAALTMPGKDAPAEEWAAFYAALGRPETPDQYEMEIPEGDDGTFAKEVAPLLHQAGITGEQAKVLSRGWNEMQAKAAGIMAQQEADRVAAMDARNRAEETALKNEWGQQHEANMHFARQAVGQFLPKENAAQVISAIESAIGYKATIQMLHGIGKGLAEHDAAGITAPAAPAEKSLAERLYGAK